MATPASLELGGDLFASGMPLSGAAAFERRAQPSKDRGRLEHSIGDGLAGRVQQIPARNVGDESVHARHEPGLGCGIDLAVERLDAVPPVHGTGRIPTGQVGADDRFGLRPGFEAQARHERDA